MRDPAATLCTLCLTTALAPPSRSPHRLVPNKEARSALRFQPTRNSKGMASRGLRGAAAGKRREGCSRELLGG
eukprot:1672123-Prymnesium_polylepis.1